MRKEKARNNKAFSHKTRVGVLDSLRKLFNTPTLIHLAEWVGFEPTCPCGQLDFEGNNA